MGYFVNRTAVMNLFFLDPDPTKAAVVQCDKHIVKMPTETGQIVSFAWHLLRPNHGKPIYRLCKRQANKGCCVWARETRGNYRWAIEHGLALCAEYTRRYGKTHASEAVLRECSEPPDEVPDGPLTPPAQIVRPEDIMPHTIMGAVLAYRNYYRWKPTVMDCRWAYSTKPEWMDW